MLWMMLPPIGFSVIVSFAAIGYCPPFGGGMPACFSAAWSVSVWLGDGCCWLLCHAFRMADGLFFGGDMVSCLPYLWLMFCDAPHGGVAWCWPGLARTLPLGARCCERLPLGASSPYFFSWGRVCLCAPPALFVAIRGAWLWPPLELSLHMLQHLSALCFPHLGVGMYWAPLAPTLWFPWSIRPGLLAQEQVCSFVYARVRLASPSCVVWCARAARVAAHPAAWLLIMAVVVVVRILTGPTRYCPRPFPCPASVLLSWHASFLLVPRFAFPRTTVWLLALGDTARPCCRSLPCVRSSWLASHLLWAALFNYCLSLSRLPTPLRIKFLPYLFIPLCRILITSLSLFRVLSCLLCVFSASFLLFLFCVYFFCNSTMADSILSKLGELTFTAEEQDAVVVTPDAVAIPAEDFACSLVDDKVQGIYEISPNFFLIAFASPANRANVLKRGPSDFQKYWFALEQADPNRTIHDYSFQHMRIWVRIHNIPLSLMTAPLARALGASVGKVIITDTRLEDGNMGEFMRVRVSFDTSKPLRRCVVLSRPDAKASMCPLQYERLPLFCHGCGLIGHSVLACPTTPKVEGQKFQYGAWLRAPLPKRSASRPRGRLSVVDYNEDVPEMGLSAALIAAQREGRLPGVCASKHGPPVNHLLFVDDSLVFLRNDMSEVHCLKDILTTYSTVSGQKVNFSKSTAYFSPRTPSEHRLAVHETLGVQEVSDPGIYLGVPLLIGKNKYAAFGRYRDKVDTQGRARPVAGPLWPGPISVCLKLQGMGFKDLHLFNIALLGKQLWRLLSEPGSLIYRTLRAKYFPDGDLLHASAPARSSFAWKGLHHALLRLHDGFYWTLGIDSQVRLFRDRWGGFSPGTLVGGSADREEIPLRCCEFMLPGKACWDLISAHLPYHLG
ncbi:hypothetical protein GQ457_05G022590 [Hibiscus cannabinus]